MTKTIQRSFLLLLAILFSASVVFAAELTLPNEFESGKKAVASEVNENFSAVKIAVDSNSAEIITNKAAIGLNTEKGNNNSTAIGLNTAEIDANRDEITINTNAISANRSDIDQNGMDLLINSNDIDTQRDAISDIYQRLAILENCAKGRFCDMEDGTVRDNKTGLIWLRDGGLNLSKNWDDAQNYVAIIESGLAGLTDGSQPGDWRLPTRSEWEEFVVTGMGYNPPVCNTAGTGPWRTGDIFTGIYASPYWTSTEETSTTVFIVMMTNGAVAVRNKTGANGYARIWPVRDRKNF